MIITMTQNKERMPKSKRTLFGCAISILSTLIATENCLASEKQNASEERLYYYRTFMSKNDSICKELEKHFNSSSGSYTLNEPKVIYAGPDIYTYHLADFNGDGTNEYIMINDSQHGVEFVRSSIYVVRGTKDIHALTRYVSMGPRPSIIKERDSYITIDGMKLPKLPETMEIAPNFTAYFSPPMAIVEFLTIGKNNVVAISGDKKDVKSTHEIGKYEAYAIAFKLDSNYERSDVCYLKAYLTR